MSTNLRLPDELAMALRETAARTGVSQQQIVRDALAKELGMAPAVSEMQRAVIAGEVEAPEPFVDVEPSLTLQPGVSVLDLLDRDER